VTRVTKLKASYLEKPWNSTPNNINVEGWNRKKINYIKDLKKESNYENKNLI